MNETLQNFARNYLKENLRLLPEDWQLTFKRIYSHQNLYKPINEIVDDMPEERLDTAMEQVRRSVEKLSKEA